VRLVLFNLDQQKELYRKEGFVPGYVKVWQAMTNIELGMVDFRCCRTVTGMWTSSLTWSTVRSRRSRPATSCSSWVRWHASSKDAGEQPGEAAGRVPQFYYFQIAPFMRQGPVLGDTIKAPWEGWAERRF
jgi:hypothetical protein